MAGRAKLSKWQSRETFQFAISAISLEQYHWNQLAVHGTDTHDCHGAPSSGSGRQLYADRDHGRSVFFS